MFLKKVCFERTSKEMFAKSMASIIADVLRLNGFDANVYSFERLDRYEVGAIVSNAPENIVNFCDEQNLQFKKIKNDYFVYMDVYK